MTNWHKRVLRFICICLLLMQSLAVVDYALAQNPPPRPPPGSSSGSGGGNGQKHHDDDKKDKGVIRGDITGTVVDLSTGLPGAGLTVQINDIPIRTDTSGHFSLTGIADGTYLVALSLPAEFKPAQPDQIVIIANRNKIDLNLGYYSLEPSLITEPILGESPEALPVTGSASPQRYAYLINILGGILVLMGTMTWIFGKEFDRK